MAILHHDKIKILKTAQEVVLGKVFKSKELDEITDEIESRMQSQWYNSDETDFSFYSEEDYKYILLKSWQMSAYDLDYIFHPTLDDKLLLPTAETFFDYHGGMGLTAIRIAMFRPHVHCITHTIVPRHGEWCKEVCERLDVKNVEVVDTIVPCDVLVCQETLEHLRNPYEELDTLLDMCKPQQYLDGTSFEIENPGHFSFYDMYGEIVPRMKARDVLRSQLRSRGYDLFWERREGYKWPYGAKPKLWDGPKLDLPRGPEESSRYVKANGRRWSNHLQDGNKISQ